jgi:hypothetical protein
MTDQLSLFSGQQPAPPAAPTTATRVIVRAQQELGRGQQHQEPEPPDFQTFTINLESRYAADEQEADALAAICATELKGYLFSARLLEIAHKAGRNPLYRNAREFTENQLKELAEAIREARSMADWMLSECQNAFGEEDAERLRQYAQACVDSVIGDEAPTDPEQPDLF